MKFEDQLENIKKYINAMDPNTITQSFDMHNITSTSTHLTSSKYKLINIIRTKTIRFLRTRTFKKDLIKEIKSMGIQSNVTETKEMIIENFLKKLEENFKVALGNQKKREENLNCSKGEDMKDLLVIKEDINNMDVINLKRNNFHSLYIHKEKNRVREYINNMINKAIENVGKYFDEKTEKAIKIFERENEDLMKRLVLKK